LARLLHDKVNPLVVETKALMQLSAPFCEVQVAPAALVTSVQLAPFYLQSRVTVSITRIPVLPVAVAALTATVVEGTESRPWPSR